MLPILKSPFNTIIIFLLIVKKKPLKVRFNLDSNIKIAAQGRVWITIHYTWSYIKINEEINKF